MIDTSKLLSKRTSRKALLSREGVTNLIIIKKNVVKIDGLLKERLVLSKVREGLLKQQRENVLNRFTGSISMSGVAAEDIIEVSMPSGETNPFLVNDILHL